MAIKLELHLADDFYVKRGDIINISNELHTVSYLVRRVYRKNWWYELKKNLGIKTKPRPRARVKILTPHELLIQLKKRNGKIKRRD